eukprot:gnl/TRDRNA2_/TRDRNA2_165509_c1_seq2.p1 gnl/TRDRNA2_/TRDRNA2_165509_c1~~gnl/TRDRNA2_/TRDRNA2_165509_c1_seq2.p1  ORF type:complete len:149 (+),score=12.06 gnl/TRDRNA2_/TRDRNA2_165509_c1_seq2:54-449(+)
MAIQGLRNGSKFISLFLASLNKFIDCVSVLHEIFDRERCRKLQDHGQIKDQMTAMQRTYFESFGHCIRIRDTIVRKWNQLETSLSDAQVVESVKRILTSRGDAYQRLSSPSITVPKSLVWRVPSRPALTDP